MYSRGLANVVEFDEFYYKKLDNVKALCEHGLEPILAEFGPLSIGYGYISPQVSKALVKYQDPDKPSHHRFDLGAAADICVHRWVSGGFPAIMDLYAPESAVGSPIGLAHALDYLNIPYSRMITYSESPYLCLAISADEVERGRPREAFYENRYTGRRKVKPDYRQYATQLAKTRAFADLQNNGLAHDWRGAGYPTYHGGGFQQYQHMRVSKYTMVSDWLFDLKSISEGVKNIPSLNLDSVQDAFAAAGTVYDWMIDNLLINRMPITAGYVSHVNRLRADYNDWRKDKITFVVGLPTERELSSTLELLTLRGQPGVEFSAAGDQSIVACIDVDQVLRWE